MVASALYYLILFTDINMLHVLSHFRKTFQFSCSQDMWLGYLRRSGSFSLLNGTVPSFFNWAPAEPVNTNGYDYVYTSGWSYGNLTWHASLPSVVNAFACRTGKTETTKSNKI